MTRTSLELRKSDSHENLTTLRTHEAGSPWTPTTCSPDFEPEKGLATIKATSLPAYSSWKTELRESKVRVMLAFSPRDLLFPQNTPEEALKRVCPSVIIKALYGVYVLYTKKSEHAVADMDMIFLLLQRGPTSPVERLCSDAGIFAW